MAIIPLTVEPAAGKPIPAPDGSGTQTIKPVASAAGAGGSNIANTVLLLGAAIPLLIMRA